MFVTISRLNRFSKKTIHVIRKAGNFWDTHFTIDIDRFEDIESFETSDKGFD
jgi:hypothetical protein